MNDDSKDKNHEKDRERRNDLLVADLNNTNTSFLANEEAGERRVQFFIGLLTAVIAVLGVIGVEAIRGAAGPGGTQPSITTVQALLNPRDLALTATIALIALLAFGYLIFLRIVKRDCVTEEYKAISSYRRKSLHLDDPFDVVKEIEERKDAAQKVKAGGLAQLLLFINGALLVLIAILAIPAFPALKEYSGLLIGLSVVVTVLLGWQLNQWSKKRRRAYRDALGEAFAKKLSPTR